MHRRPELLVSLIGEDRLEQERAQAELLCQDVGYLPLGLELVGRYLKRKANLSLAEILTLAHKALQKKDRKGETSREMTAKRGVEAAFELSWQELDRTEQELACLLSLFALAPIAWELVEQISPEQDATELAEIRDDVLVNLSLLQDQGNNTYQLHPLIREFLNVKREVQESATVMKLKRGFCQAMVTVAQTIPYALTREQILNVTLAIPHLTEVAEGLADFLSDEDLFWPFTGLGRFYQGQGLYQTAEPWRKQCLEICQNRLGESHPDVATSLGNLALLYYSQGRYEAAEPLYLRGLQILFQRLGQDHPNTQTGLQNYVTFLERVVAEGRQSELSSEMSLQLISQMLRGIEDFEQLWQFVKSFLLD